MRSAMRPVLPVVALLIIALNTPLAAQPEGIACDPEPTDQTVPLGTMINCSIGSAGDSDVYHFWADGNEHVLIRVTRRDNSLGRACFELITPSNNRIVQCNQLQTEAVLTTLNETGMHTVLVYEFGNNQTVNYSLQIEPVIPASPNAVPIEYGQMLTNLRIDPIGDNDFYTFGGTAGTTVSIRMEREGTSITETCLQLIAPNSTEFVECNATTVNTLDVTLPQDGTYTIIASERSNDELTNYSLRLQCLTGPCFDEETVAVPATSDWLDTGVALSGGQYLALRANASWSPDPGAVAVGPVGRPRPCSSAPACPLVANQGALVARIGANPPFFVGEGLSFQVDPAWSGNLQLRINDDALGDNLGSANVYVLRGLPVAVESRPGGPRTLGAATPNPFSQSTRIRFAVPRAGVGAMHVYDIAGRRVRELIGSSSLAAGEYDVEWDGRGDDGQTVAPGVYFYRLNLDGRSETRRAVLVK